MAALALRAHLFSLLFSPPQCNNDYSPVCGSNNQNYQNECFLRRDACKQQSEVLIMSEGACPAGTYVQTSHSHPNTRAFCLTRAHTSLQHALNICRGSTENANAHTSHSCLKAHECFKEFLGRQDEMNAIQWNHLDIPCIQIAVNNTCRCLKWTGLRN